MLAKIVNTIYICIWPLELNLKHKTDDIERETRIEIRGENESEKLSTNIDLIFNVIKASFIEKP